jgi:16S rRNA A1518/A1519 N6-dimethyltransferase RsmA/KsgA/DIM1 with predicted DNA glycosylase/AP lyase activity
MAISFVLIIILLIVLTFVWPPDSPWSPWWRTSKKKAIAACRLAKISKSDIVYELGSGDGEFILTAAESFHVKKAIGIEIDYTRYYVSQLKKQLRKTRNTEFVRKDFKKVKLNEATVVYFYLVPRVIKRIMPKLKKELRPGTRIVSYRYELPLPLIKKDAVSGMYLYKV